MAARFSLPIQSGSGAHSSSCKIGTWRGVDRPPSSSAEVKERVQLKLYSHYGFLALLYVELDVILPTVSF